MDWKQNHTSSQSQLNHQSPSQQSPSYAVHQPGMPYLAGNVRLNDMQSTFSGNATGTCSMRPQNPQNIFSATANTATQQHTQQLSNQKQPQLWLQQQANFLQPNIMIQPTASPGNWQNQQQNPQQQQLQQVVGTTGPRMYHPPPTARTPPQNWQQAEQHTAPVQQQQPTASNYGNYYTQQPKVQAQLQPQLPLQQQSQQQLAQQPSLHYYQQQAAAATYCQAPFSQQQQQTLLQQTQQQPELQQPQQPQVPQTHLQQQPPQQAQLQSHSTSSPQQQQLLPNVNDGAISNEKNNTKINNNTGGFTADCWNDWDWNENLALSSGSDMQLQSVPEAQCAPIIEQQVPLAPQQQQQQHHQQQQHQQQQQQHQHQQQPHPPTVDQGHSITTNIIEESFGSQCSNNWHWPVNATDDAANANPVESQSVTPPAAPLPFSAPQALPIANASGLLHHQQLQPNSYQVHQQQQLPAAASSVQPTTPTTLQYAEIPNETYGSISVAAATVGAPNNIPNSVYLSQAKPVPRPSRQYASPPDGSTPVETSDSALTPPQGFENDVAVTPANSTMPPPPMTSSVALPSAAAASTVVGNPFKRFGAVQHHRASLLPTTTAPVVTLGTLTSSYGVPPPPADFANPAECLPPQPDNSEVLFESKKVITGSAVSVTSTIHASSMAPATPPNDERAQYLQTSHLSENPDEELTLDGDNLPPPGLSRLVLGQPEVEASLRMVTGTEQPITSVGAVAMDIEERHADGEDTSMEQTTSAPIALTISRTGNVGSAVSASPHIDISHDRNLYLVLGESNAADELRVVTGVETTPAAAAAPIISEQREIELDGENLEDERNERGVLVAARNDPPLEGAASMTEVSQASAHAESTVESHVQGHNHGHLHGHGNSHAHHYTTQAKEPSHSSTSDTNSSTDESDALEREQERDKEREHHHAAKAANSANTAGKVRRHDERELRDKNQDKSHLLPQRKDKREHVRDRGQYDSDGSATVSDVDSSDREREREHERHRGYREGSARSDRDDRERDYLKETKKRRDQPQHHRGSEASSSGGKPATERRSKRYNRYEGSDELASFDKSAASRRNGSGRLLTDKSSGGDRSERDYDDYRRKTQRGSTKRSGGMDREVGRERRHGNDNDRHHGNRSDGYDTLERPRPRDQQRLGRIDRRNHEEYRKPSSRNARDSDVEKERGIAAGHYDPRHMVRYGAYPYDPYAFYYYQMAYSNPQAYAELKKKYYGYTAASSGTLGGPGSSSQAGTAGDHHHPPQHPHQHHHQSSAVNSMNNSSAVAADGGRESVHSGRSSQTQNEKDRYTNAYIKQVNEYRRHLHQRQQYQYQQQEQQHHHRQHQYQYQAALNSTMFDDGHGNANINDNRNTSAGLRTLGGARSTGNLLHTVSFNQTPGGGSGIHYHGPSEGRAFMYAESDYGDSRSEFSIRGDMDMVGVEQERLTPCKFVVEHSVVSIASNVLLTVKPKHTHQGVIANVVKFQRLGTNDATRRLFHHFAGPLVRGKTHKKSVIKFCEEQIRSGPSPTAIFAKQTITAASAENHKASHAMLWNLLILLLRQNGMVVGTDIAELLLKNQLEFPYEVQSTDNEARDNSDRDADGSMAKVLQDHDKDQAEQDGQESPKTEEERPEVNEHFGISQSAITLTAPGNSITEAEITDKFRNYLLYGNVNEALDWATDNNLWGHALFLASKVDRRAHANVMMKFANKLALNDPLQTLYQLMSGRSPSSVTSVQDERWGDWRPHLSMILSNTSQKPELDRRAITTLGDSLFNRGDLFGAHFCYLMAQVSFGRYQPNAAYETTLQQHLPKLVLLGTSHYKSLNEFATNEAIIMTLIYEYACSLNDEKFSLVELQPYKFLLATRMLDYGYHLKSLMYLEQIAQHIERDPSKFEPSFKLKIYDFADRLKYYDPALERSLADEQSPENSSHLNGDVPGAAVPHEEQKWLQTLRSIVAQQALDHNTGATLASSMEASSGYQMQQHIDDQFVEINKQFNELNLQYATIAESTFYNPDASHQQQQHELPATDAALSTLALGAVVDQHEQQPIGLGTNDYEKQQQQRNDTASLDAYAQVYGQQFLTQEQHEQQQQQAGYGYESRSTHFGDAAETTSAPASYDYWVSQQQPQEPQLQHQYLGSDKNAHPTISLPQSRTYDSDDDGSKRKRHDSSHSAAQHPPQQQSRKQHGKVDGKDLAAKSGQQTSQNSGWFGGIWGKLLLKPKNQAILPDDKNPTIVWDAEKKRWVNTDGDETTEETLKPPPKISDILPQHLNSHQQQPFQQYGQPQTAQQQMQQPFMDAQQHYGVTTKTPTSAPSPSPDGQQAPAISSNVQSYSASGAAPTGGDGAAAGGDSVATGLAKPPSLQSNMFKMQRNRTLKNSYIDVFNPSGAPMSKAADSVLAPALPPAIIPQGGYFIPGAVPVAGDSQYQRQQKEQQPAYAQTVQQDVPQFYNPNQFGIGGTGH